MCSLEEESILSEKEKKFTGTRFTTWEKQILFFEGVSEKAHKDL
jgi:hypothetical protein